MVSAKIILALLSVAVFFVAGGGSLIRPAFAQARTDFESIRGGLTEQVKNIRAKTKAGEAGDSVG